jgi:hypothetical protein
MPNSLKCKNNSIESFLLDKNPDEVKEVPYGNQYIFSNGLIVNVHGNSKDKTVKVHFQNEDESNSSLKTLISKKIELINNPPSE